MVSEFLSWWTAQLWTACPHWLRPTAPGAGRGPVLALRLIPGHEPNVEAFARTKPGLPETSLGRFSLDRAGLVALRAALSGRPATLLRVPDTIMLHQDTSLPLAAEPTLQRVLGYEMDRITPFRANQVEWSATVTRRDPAQDRLMVRLWLVPRAVLTPVLEALASAGMRVGAVASGAGFVTLAPVAMPPWQVRTGVAAAVGGVALAAAAAGLPFVVQSARRAEVEARIVALQPVVTQVDALRRRSLDGASADVFAQVRARSGDVLGGLATLTAVLGDDTVLQDLTLRSRTIVMSGTSAAATRLIPALAAEPGLRNPAFAAPVMRTDGARAEGFSIRAELAP